MATNWGDDDNETLVRLHKEGRSAIEIAGAIGRSYESVRGRLRFLGLALNPVKRGPKPRAVDIAPQEKQALHAASTDAQLRELKEQLRELKAEKELAAIGTGLGRMPVESHAEPPETPEAMWKHAEDDSARRIKFYEDRTKFSIDFDKTDAHKPVAVSFISDQHISPGNIIDFKRMREDAELIAQVPGCYAILGGDGVDNHIAIRSAGLAARSQPAEQWQLYEWYLSLFAPKILAMISGNHDAWTDQIAGIDMVAELARKQRLCYSPAEAFIYSTLGDVPYTIACRHQFNMGSRFNLLHCVKQWLRLGEEPFDIGTICHEHEAAAESFNFHGKERWGFRPGAYQIGSSYVRQYGWNKTKPTCPTAVIYPHEREIVGFRDLRPALRFLEAERARFK